MTCLPIFEKKNWHLGVHGRLGSPGTAKGFPNGCLVSISWGPSIFPPKMVHFVENDGKVSIFNRPFWKVGDFIVIVILIGIGNK